MRSTILSRIKIKSARHAALSLSLSLPLFRGRRETLLMRQTNCAHTVIMQLFLITRLISSGNSVLRMLMQTWGQGFRIILKSLLMNFLFILRNFHQRNPTNCILTDVIDILKVLQD